jgi:flagellar protein FliO/FliZ
MDTAVLGLRVALSLACVLGLIWFAGRRLQGTAALRKPRSVPMTVLGRQTLGKGASLALVEIAGRVLLLGVGEQGVRVLTELDVPEAPDAGARLTEVREEIDLSALLADAAPDPGSAAPARGAAPAGVPAAAAGALHGSVLSPDTWRRAVDVVQRRTAR